MDLEITGIKFNYLSESGSAYASPIHLSATPEWPLRKHAAVAYPLDQIVGKVISIQACFKALSEATDQNWVTVRARLGPNEVNSTPDSRDILNHTFQFTRDSFSSRDSVYGYIPIEINTEVLWEEKVGVYQSRWIWEWQLYSLSGETSDIWHEFTRTFHRVYILLSKPGWPWGRTNASTTDGFNNPPPAIGVVELACDWASGATDCWEAASKITQKLVGSGRWKYSLDPSYMNSAGSLPGVPDGVSASPGLHLFKLLAFLDRMKGYFGNNEYANCTDFATMLLILGNSIGCGLKKGKLSNDPDENGETSFDLGPSVVAIGSPAGAYSCFSMHEIAFIGDQLNENALIFDASLGFESSEEIVGNYSLSPVTNLPFADFEGIQGYQSRLAKIKEECQPQPLENIVVKFA